MPAPRIRLSPQDGPQREFLSTAARIAIYGGSAGGGKSFALLLECLRHRNVQNCPALLFRRTCADAKKPGGLWDASCRIYPLLGYKGSVSDMKWRHPNSGATVTICHMEHDKDRFNFMGTEVPLICFDELTHFSADQFWFMLSRNRSTTGVPAYIRATCNPDPDSFVAKLVEWYIDQQTGLAIPERSGVVRWFCRLHDELVWSDTREELVARFGDECEPTSFTFIRSSVYDNKIFLKADPGYVAALKNLPRVDRERLLYGNWKVRPAAGMMFKRHWFEIVDAVPASGRIIRTWDLAGSERKAKSNDPDWTASLKMLQDNRGVFYVMDVIREQANPLRVEQMLENTAKADGLHVSVVVPQDPGQAGKFQADYFVRRFAGVNIHAQTVQNDKVTRAGPASAQAERGNIKLLRGAWNDTFITELENFPDGKNDDQVDVLSDAVNYMGVFGSSTTTVIKPPEVAGHHGLEMPRMERPRSGVWF